MSLAHTEIIAAIALSHDDPFRSVNIWLRSRSRFRFGQLDSLSDGVIVTEQLDDPHGYSVGFTDYGLPHGGFRCTSKKVPKIFQ